MLPGHLRSASNVIAVAFCCASVVLLASCGGDDGSPTAPQIKPGEVVTDFNLLDVNTTSATHDQQVSPKDYLKRISAWYFGFAT